MKQIKEDEPKLGKQTRVLKVPINEIYNYAADPKSVTGSEELVFRFMPDAAEVVSALEVSSDWLFGRCTYARKCDTNQPKCTLHVQSIGLHCLQPCPSWRICCLQAKQLKVVDLPCMKCWALVWYLRLLDPSIVT